MPLQRILLQSLTKFKTGVTLAYLQKAAGHKSASYVHVLWITLRLPCVAQHDAQVLPKHVLNWLPSFVTRRLSLLPEMVLSDW